MPDGFTDSGFTDDGLAALDAALAGHVASGAGDNGAGANTVPGLVALVARGGRVHVACAGHKALGDGEPIGRDAIFRIASLTKPIVGATAMLLIEDGAMALDDPVDRWLPELSDRRVLRRFDAELTDTVPRRPGDHGRGRALVPARVRLRLRAGSAAHRAGRGFSWAEHARATLAADAAHPGRMDRRAWPPAADRPAGRGMAVQHRGHSRGHLGRAGRGGAARRGAQQAGIRAARHGGHGILRARNQTGTVHQHVRADPTTGLTGILLTQRMATSPEPSRLTTDFWSGAYAAIAK
jgi:CubicO group peptidase (beta-lactamase class C family)